MTNYLLNKRLASIITLSSFAFISSCASKPEGYVALPPGSDIASEIDQLESSFEKSKSSHYALIAPQAFKKAKSAMTEAKEGRASDKDNEKILEKIAISKAYLKQAETAAQVSSQALAPVLEARTQAIEAEADRVLAKKLSDLDDDLKDMARDIEKDGNLNPARDDGPDLEKKYAQLRTESLEKGGRPDEQRALKQEVKDLRAQKAATNKDLQLSNTQTQALSGELNSAANQRAKLNMIREKFSAQEADVLVNRENEIVIRLKGLNFPVNKSDIPSDSLPLLSKLQQALEEFPNSKITIEGHTDSMGSKEINDTLSKARAEAISGFLIQSQA
jgi:outer membrane protein OmpA-like peptidoglycan-associated protein